MFHLNGNDIWMSAIKVAVLNPLTPNNPYRSRTAPLTSKRCILYIYSTNIGTEYFKHSTYSPFFPLQNAVCFIILTYLVPVLFTFYIHDVLKLKKNNSGAKRLIWHVETCGSIYYIKRYCCDINCVFVGRNKNNKNAQYLDWNNCKIRWQLELDIGPGTAESAVEYNPISDR